MADVGAVAAQQLINCGFPIRVGERVQLVYTRCSSRLPSERVRAYALLDDLCHYDVKKYTQLLCKATETLLIHFGWDYQTLLRRHSPG